MNNLIIVAEGRTDVTLLRTYLPRNPDLTTRFFAGAGKMSLASLARNILVHEGGPVLIVMDADSLNPDNAEQNRGMVRAALGQVAPEELFEVFAYRPEHEVIFFEAPEVLKRQASIASMLTPRLLDRGLYDPKGALEEILMKSETTRASWFGSLTAEDGELLRTGAQARRLVTMFKALAGDKTMAA